VRERFASIETEGPVKLRKRTKNSFYVLFWSLFMTGTAAWIFDQWIRVPGAFGEEHHWLQPWTSRLHTFSAYLVLIALGYLLHAHVKPGLKGKKRKVTGISMLTFFGVLAISSLPILYAGEGTLRNSTTWIHTYLGLATPLFLAAHLWKKQDYVAKN